jgi:hypothetical protein
VENLVILAKSTLAASKGNVLTILSPRFDIRTL